MRVAIVTLAAAVCITLLNSSPSTELLSNDFEENQVSDRQLIEAAISEFTEAYNSGNLNEIIKYYGEDLIKVRNGAPPETKPETTQRIRDVFEHYRTRVEVVTDEIEVHGDMAFTRGTFRVTLTPKSAEGQAQILNRRYLEIWRKEQGRWRVVRTMDNVE